MKRNIDGSEDEAVMVIDAGKTFIQAAVEWFPKYGLRKIDGVVLTHPHADAVNGLDDLRSWTTKSADIQDAVDVYLSESTYKDVARAFPYLVSKEAATGSGIVPSLRWHFIEEGVPFNIKDGAFTVTPVNVHHGRHFGSSPPEQSAVPITPLSVTPAPSAPVSGRVTPEVPATQPYLCFSFVINSSILYMSDVSFIPDSAWTEFLRHQFQVVIVDCLKVDPLSSHFGIAEAYETAQRLKPQRTYLTGFSHDLTHKEWVQVGEILGGKEAADPGEKVLKAVMRVNTKVQRDGLVWIRPAHDGLRFFLSNGLASDEES